MAEKIIVISAVNLVEAGTLAILKECLGYLSTLASNGEYKIIALVHKKELAYFPNIEYIETQWPKKNWFNRIWFEYIGMFKISKNLGHVFLWFSLHDTTPSVKAERKAVYCHNAFFSYKWSSHDLFFAPKIALFSIFTKFIYRVNIKANNYLVVQQVWFRNAISQMFSIDKKKIIVARPESYLNHSVVKFRSRKVFSFIYAGSPNSHKNFETICKAANILKNGSNRLNFKILITVSGDENKYSKWLSRNWGNLECIEFAGFLSKNSIHKKYNESDCLIYPSKVESWGLPISEFSQFGKPMLLADLPYAHETAQGSELTAFFDPENPDELAEKMSKLIQGDYSFLKNIPIRKEDDPIVSNWKDLFSILLK